MTLTVTISNRAPKSVSINDFISVHLDRQQKAGRTLSEIASEAGFSRPNILSMFTTGAARVPLDRVPGLAAALRVDPGMLFRLAMLQYWPDLHHVVAKIFGDVTTPNERELLGLFRFVTQHEDPKISLQQKSEIERILKNGT